MTHSSTTSTPARREYVPVSLTLHTFTYTPVGRSAPTLDSATLTIPAGQRVLLTGASGSGKSTLLKALAGLIPADGEEEADPTPGTTLMVQNPTHAFVGAAAGLDIAFAPENAGRSVPDIEEIVACSRESARFTPPLTSDPFAVSGGQQQRLSLAGVFACDAGAILLDEPLTMLDADTGLAVRDAIVEAAGERTIVIADHAPEPWLGYVDRVIRVADGGSFCDVPRSEWDSLRRVRHADAAGGESSRRQSAGGQAAATADSPQPLIDVTARNAFNGRELFAHPVGLRAAAGELIAITGISGVGKSTFLRHVLECSRDERPKGKPYRAAWLPQNPETSFVASRVRDEVATGAASTDAADEAMQAVGISHLAHANPFAISGGEQRRTAFASALATGRRVLVLDEPTVGLDDASFAAVMKLINEALSQGIAVIAATHDERLASTAQRVIHLVPHPNRDDLDGAAGTRPPSALSPSEEAHVPRVPRLPRRVPADRLNQVTILAIAACAFLGSLAVHSIGAGLVALAISLALIPLTFRTPKRLAMRLVPVSLAALTIAWSVLLLSGHSWCDASTWRAAASEGLRIFAMVAPGALVLESVEATRLGQALAQNLRLPARPAAAGIAGLSRMGHLFGEWTSIMTTRAIRGIHQRNPIKLYAGATFALLVGTLRAAEVQSLAMDARGFATATGRSWVHRSRFSRHDVWGAAIAALVLLAPAAATLVV